MKIFRKERLSDGRRHIYFFGVKVLSYRKKVQKTVEISSKESIKVSVIIPVYNVARYLDQCLRSLTRQTLREIEIICVNDGSTDGSMEILNEYSSRDPRVKVVNKENSGAPSCRNIGLKLAKGEYVGFIDSDDWVDSNYYEKLYMAAITQDADIARCTYKYCYGDRTEDSELNKVILKRIAEKEPLHVNEHSIVIWNAIYRTKFLRVNKIDYFDDLRMSHDVPFTARVDFLSRKTVPVSGTYYYYRKDRDGQLITPSQKRLECVMASNSIVVDFLNSLDSVETADYMTAYKRVLWRVNYNKKLYAHSDVETAVLERLYQHHEDILNKCKYPSEL